MSSRVLSSSSWRAVPLNGLALSGLHSSHDFSSLVGLEEMDACEYDPLVNLSSLSHSVSVPIESLESTVISNDGETSRVRGKGKKNGVKKSKEKESKESKEKESKEKKSNISKEKTEHEEINEEEVKSKAGEWTTFHLNPKILYALQKLGFDSPSPIQKMVITKTAHAMKDVVACAQTGSGKTLAFGIPIVERLLREYTMNGLLEGLCALILTPTRELAIQVKEHIHAVLKYTSLTVYFHFYTVVK